MFRTLKYCPHWPSQGFASLLAAREWMSRFVPWYNKTHRHSQFRFVTPAQRHHGEDRVILARSDQVYAQAKKRHPARWSGATRNWTPVGPVTLNPERNEAEIKQAA